MLDRFKTYDGVPPSFYRAKIVETLKLNGDLVINIALMEGSAFSTQIKDGEEYKIKKLVKIDGWGNAHLKIKRCDGEPLTQDDISLLHKNEIIKVTASPAYKTKPGYDL